LGEEKEQRKEAGGKIIFGTKQVRVLTSPECMARLKLYKEWVTVKKYNKSLLIESVKRYGFSDQEIRDSKTKPVLLRRVQEFLLAEEEKLTSTFEAELRDVQADIPQHLDDFFIRNPSSTPSVDPSPPPDVEPLIVTSIVDSSPTFGVPSDSLIKEATNWPLSMDLEE